MYKHFIRPVLFLFPPETIHHIIKKLFTLLIFIPGLTHFLRRIYLVRHPKLKRTVAGLTFDNPVGLAAGFDKDAQMFNQLAGFGFSFIEIGTLTPKGQPGNPRPRLFRLVKDSALINRMGFNNVGIDKAINNLKKRHTNVIIGGNIGKNTATPNEEALHDYVYGFESLYPYVDYFVVNVSCPNIANLVELQDQASLQRILTRLGDLRQKKRIKKPIFLKISPDLTFQQLDETLDIIRKTQIDGIVATNTTTKRDGLKSKPERITNIGKGGLSGQPLRKRSTEMIRYIREKTRGSIPIIGVGGIMTTEDAFEKLEAGADLIQVYTGFIYQGPSFVKDINQYLLNQLNN
ncbi:MAG: quinone-dependent dihydroorotate dehydrogenase [Bacteroidota bacterium]